MKTNPSRLPALLLLATLAAGCKTGGRHGEELVMPQVQQNTYLARAKPPQQYGFNVFPVRDGISFRGDARLHPNHQASLRLAKGGVPVVELRGSSPRLRLNTLLDPSSPVSWLEFSKSQEFNAVFFGLDGKTIPYRGGYNTGGADAYAGVVTQLRADRLFIENVPFFIRMASFSLGPLARGIRKPHFDAVLGYDTLRLFEYVQFDFDRETVELSSTLRFLPHEDLLMAKVPIVRVANHGLAVNGAIFGEATPILLDFAGDFHFARGDVKVSSTRQVELGDLVFRKVPTLLLPAHDSPPRAGRRLLEKYIVTICNREGFVYFERLPR